MVFTYSYLAAILIGISMPYKEPWGYLHRATVQIVCNFLLQLLGELLVALTGNHGKNIDIKHAFLAQ